MKLNLFALTMNPERRVLRFSLSAEAQQEVSDYFLELETDFENIISEEHEFDGKYKPDVDECLFIKDFDDIDNLHKAIRDSLTVPAIGVTEADFLLIKALFVGYEKDGVITILLQRFDRRKILSAGGLSLFYSGDTFRKVDGLGVTIDRRLSAVLKAGHLRAHPERN